MKKNEPDKLAQAIDAGGGAFVGGLVAGRVGAVVGGLVGHWLGGEASREGF